VQEKIENITLLRRAARGRWNVPQKVKERAVAEIEIILSDVTSDDRLKLDAIKTAAQLDKLDLEADKIKDEMETGQMATTELLEKLNNIIGHENVNRLFPRLTA
jgi:hypothetical protein